jgi:hypothetical protein
MSRAGLALASLLLVACATTSPAASPASSAPASAFAASCPAIDLRLPDGTQLDLTGAWVHTLSRTFHLYQSGSCLWWAGGQPDETLNPDLLGPSGANTMVFHGEVRSDFTIVGEWAILGDDVPVRSWGTAELRIEADDAGEIRIVAVSREGNDYNFLTDTFLRRAE